MEETIEIQMEENKRIAKGRRKQKDCKRKTCYRRGLLEYSLVVPSSVALSPTGEKCRYSLALHNASQPHLDAAPLAMKALQTPLHNHSEKKESNKERE